MTSNGREAEQNISRTSKPVIVSWDGALSGGQTVQVNPYTANIIVNGRVFDIGALCSNDVPSHLFRETTEDHK